MPQSSTWEAIEERLCQVFSPLTVKMHMETRIHSTPYTKSETLQENSQRFKDLVIQATGTNPTAVTCQVRSVLFIGHQFNKVGKEQVVGVQIIQTLRYAMFLAHEVEIKIKSMRD